MMDGRARRELDRHITRDDEPYEFRPQIDRQALAKAIRLSQAATIVRKGRCKEDGYSEPYALLEDGRTMPMGWNRSGPIFEVGTRGTAVNVSTSSAGLWRFTPEDPATV